MTMINFEAQQRARNELRKVDQALAAEMEKENAVRTQAEGFRDGFFGAFQFIEQETMTMQELQVQLMRSEKNQLRVQSRGRLPFMLVLDPELAYDRRPTHAEQGQAGEQAPQPAPELTVRVFALLGAPYQGLLRYYTVFPDGTWKRTTFASGAHGIQGRHTMLQRFSADILVLEAINLLDYVCRLHASWAPLAAEAETLTAEDLRDRTRIKMHLSGLGAPRRQTGQ